MKKKYIEDLKTHDFFSINWLQSATGLSRSQIQATANLLQLRLYPIPSATGKRTGTFIMLKNDVEKLLNHIKK